MKKIVLFFSTLYLLFAAEQRRFNYSVEFEDRKCTLVSAKEGTRTEATSCILHVQDEQRVPDGIYAYDSVRMDFMAYSDSTLRITSSVMRAIQWKSVYFPKAALLETPASHLLRMLKIIYETGSSLPDSFTIINLW